MKLVTPRQPFIRREFKQRCAITAAAALPGAGVITHDLPISHPNFCPLYAGVHHVVTVGPIDRFKRIFKFDGRLNRLEVIVNFLLKLDQTESKIRFLGRDRLKFGSNLLRDERRAGDGWRTGKRGSERDGGGERDRGSQRDSWRQRGSERGWKIAVGKTFTPAQIGIRKREQ